MNVYVYASRLFTIPVIILHREAFVETAQNYCPNKLQCVSAHARNITPVAATCGQTFKTIARG
jgi:hypothetical protein